MDSSGKKLQSEYVTVTDGDNQQYVVLEVIHLEDGTEQQVTVMAPEYMEEDEQGKHKVYIIKCISILLLRKKQKFSHIKHLTY